MYLCSYGLRWLRLGEPWQRPAYTVSNPYVTPTTTGATT